MDVIGPHAIPRMCPTGFDEISGLPRPSNALLSCPSEVLNMSPIHPHWIISTKPWTIGLAAGSPFSKSKMRKKQPILKVSQPRGDGKNA